MNKKTIVGGRLSGVEFETSDSETVDVVKRIVAKTKDGKVKKNGAP